MRSCSIPTLYVAVEKSLSNTALKTNPIYTKDPQVTKAIYTLPATVRFYIPKIPKVFVSVRPYTVFKKYFSSESFENYQ